MIRRALVICALGAGMVGTARAQDQVQERPLSAIDWLSDSVRVPAPARQSPSGHGRPTGDEAPVAGQILTPQVQVAPLDTAGPRAIGTRLPSDLGLGPDLWRASSADALEGVISELPQRPTAALQTLVRQLFAARAVGPIQLSESDFVRLRVDHLLQIGALEDAQDLLDAAGVTEPDLFRRYFDATLLLGHEDDACAIMDSTPSVAPTFAARIFCLARGGAWQGASQTFGTARALGELDPLEDALLARYLEPDLFEDEPVPPVSGIPSPLMFRLREAIGAPVTTSRLPRAYRVADLRHHMGWKYQLDAAETLASSGVLAPSQLIQLYTAGRPSASGGVWDRVQAVQALNRALDAQDAAAVIDSLPPAWDAMSSAQLQIPFAAIYGPRLAQYELPGRAGRLAHDVQILSPAYEATQTIDAIVDAIAQGTAPDLPAGASPRLNAVAQAFATPRPDLSAPMAGLVDAGKIGEALLRAVILFEQGRYGDPAQVRDALVTLRHLGREDTARRAAIEYILLGDAA